MFDYEKYSAFIDNMDTLVHSGKVQKVSGLTVEANGPAVRIGELCNIYTMKGDSVIKAEIAGFKDKMVILMPYGDLQGVGPGSRVVALNKFLNVPVGMHYQGRILNGLGEPLDDGPELFATEYYPVESSPPNPLTRPRIHEKLSLGVRAIDGLLTVGKGQRIGIFAGSGVGKSTLMGMIARNARSDVNVIALIGERGREVRDFIEKDLKEEGLKRSVLVVATSDQPAIIRSKAALVGTSIAEYFRDKGKNVLFMMDSLTRYAIAQREIGMAVGEPPVSRGYTPSVFANMPRLLERTGTSSKGTITALYTVLVEGDDLNEPVADTVRGILDGHIVLSRALANRNHYPAIDVLASISRLMPEIITPEHYEKANFIKSMMAVYSEAQDLINIGAYKAGSNPDIDCAIRLMPQINAILNQKVDEPTSFEDTLSLMDRIMR